MFGFELPNISEAIKKLYLPSSPAFLTFSY